MHAQKYHKNILKLIMFNNIKVLYITSQFPTPTKIRGVFTMQRVKALQKMGVEVMVVCHINKTPPRYTYYDIKKIRKWVLEQESVPDYCELEGVKIHYIKRYEMPKPIVGWYSYQFLYWQIFNKIKQLVTQEKPNIILSSWLPSSVVACKISKHFNIPAIVIAEGSDVNILPSIYRGWAFARNALNKYAAAMVFVSNALKLQAIKTGLNCKIMTCIHNGVDPDIFTLKDKKDPRGIKNILVVSDMTPVKGVQFLPETFSILCNKYKMPVQLTIIGDGPLKKKLLKEFMVLGLDGMVDFVDQMPHKNLANYYQRADLLCLPSLSEGFVCVILEALASGTPVVASRVGGVVEVIDQFNGILVSPGDPQELAEALINALEKDWNPDLIRERVINKFTWDHTGDAILDLIQRANGLPIYE